uniref:Beta-glucuronosyltransferase GlcAT14A n=1 Tax=Elaeis guineensis var. tenera TaxID=51953 RepID=A0A6I9R1C3_ELAGV|nr:beta-glucuronosyltransferase GlcAT14A [Elaeis guineensis]
MQSAPPLPSSKESRHLSCIRVTAFVALLLLLLFLSFSSSPPSSAASPLRSSAAAPLRSSAAALISSSPPPPSFAYLLSGTVGDADCLLRLLRATYHPRNLYLLHLDGAAPQAQRDRLARAVRAVPVFRSAGNVHVIGKPDFANPRGSSALAATLHAAAILLRLGPNWDWFINLHASDYPLVTQDDLLHVFSFLPKDLSFVQHSSYIGRKESRRLKPIIVDFGLYLSLRTEVFYATQKRELPNAYRLFTGSASVILSRKFVEYCILGTDNLPRALLMYYGNTPSSHMNYFQTVLCNSPEFNMTVVNHDLHYVMGDMPLKPEPRVLTTNDLENMTQSGAAFGTRFAKDDLVLNHIDHEVLNRDPSKMVPGGWCLGNGSGDACMIWGNADVLSPGPRAMKLADFMALLLSTGTLHSHQCIWD